VRFRGKVIQPWTGEIVGDLLITRCRVSFLGDIELKTGDVVGSDLDVRGMNVSGKVFVFSEGRGSTVGSNVLFGLSRKGLAPRLLATCRPELITVSGAIFGGIPMVSNIDERIFDELRSGARVKACMVGSEAYIEEIFETTSGS